jgi:hypothetical protein
MKIPHTKLIAQANRAASCCEDDPPTSISSNVVKRSRIEPKVDAENRM